jgi:trafficking protein particle complex subunit 2
MAAISLAIVGKNNEPLYLREFQDENGHGDEIPYESLFGLTSLSPTSSSQPDANAPSSSTSPMVDCSLRQQFILHAALDRLEHLAGPPPGYGWRVKSGATGTDGMFVGLLAPIEELRVYGYVTTTKIKFLLVVEDDAVPETQPNVDSEIKALMKQLHELYVQEMLNPFKDLSAPISSRRFDEQIQKHIATFNQSDGMI